MTRPATDTHLSGKPWKRWWKLCGAVVLCGDREGVVTVDSDAGGALASTRLGGVALGSASPGALGGRRSSGERLQATPSISKSRQRGVAIISSGDCP